MAKKYESCNRIIVSDSDNGGHTDTDIDVVDHIQAKTLQLTSGAD